MPIHDRGYRRYGGRAEPRARAWWVDCTGGLLERVRERRFLALLLFAGPRSWSAPCRYMCRPISPGVLSGAQRRDVSRISRSAEPVPVFRHHLRGLRAHCERSPGECAAGLPVEAADADGIRRRQAPHPEHLPRGGHVGSCHAVAAASSDVCGKHGVRSRQPLPGAGDYAFPPIQVRFSRSRCGLSSLEERGSSPSITRAFIFSPRRRTRCCGRHR